MILDDSTMDEQSQYILSENVDDETIPEDVNPIQYDGQS
jgi:hypothetical protein